MNEFFRQQLNKLHLAGIRQMEFIATKEEVDELIDMLCTISEKNFGYIPKNIQQAEIQKQIIQDPDLKTDGGITTRWLYKILSKIADKYWKEKMNSGIDEVLAEPISPERQAYWLEEWKKMISQVHENFTKGQGTGSQLKESLNQLAKAEPIERLFTVGQVCPDCNGDATVIIDDVIEQCLTCNASGEVNRKEIWAKDEEEAKKLYTP